MHRARNGKVTRLGVWGMAEYSPAVNLAWQIAADEAKQSGHAQIEPEHLLIGIFSISKALTARGAPDLPDAVLLAVRSEWDHLARAFQLAACDPLLLRRKLREKIATGKRSSQQKISRSAASRKVFARAEEVAKRNQAALLGAIELLSALLESDSVGRCLAECGCDREQLQDALSSHLGSASALTMGPSRMSITDSPITGPVEENPELVRETLDATMATAFTRAPSDSDRRLVLFYELPWEFGNSQQVDDLLQNLLQRLIEAIPSASRGTILVADPKSGELLLKAHCPIGAPAVSLTSVQRALDRREAFIWTKADDITTSQHESRSESGVYAPLVWADKTFGVISLDSHDSHGQFSSDDLRLVAAVAHQAAVAVANRQLTDDLRRNNDLLQRLLTSFSPKLRARLLEKASHGRLRPGGERSEVSILCSDIRGFTLMSADMDTADIVDMLNEYFSSLSEVIFRNDGAIDKFMGDAILAVFGSPENDPHHHSKAVRAAVEMQAAMREVNRVRANRGHRQCEIGIGVHCGEVLHGFIGASERMEFTVIGDTVNRTSRFCAAAGPGKVLISTELHQRVWKQIDAEAIQITTKHEGNLNAFVVKNIRATTHASKA